MRLQISSASTDVSPKLICSSCDAPVRVTESHGAHMGGRRHRLPHEPDLRSTLSTCTSFFFVRIRSGP